MSEPKFTPGPWEWPKFTPGPWEWYKADGEYRTLINDCLHMIIRSVRPEDMWFCPENRDANAALIAAAPELYAALENLVAWASLEETPRLADLLEAARAALAKARGE